MAGKNLKVKPFSKELLNFLFRNGDEQLSVVNHPVNRFIN